MRIRFVLPALGLLSLLSSAASAQDFGVMESAETLDRGNFKLTANPVYILGEDGADGELGVALKAGYGFTGSLDAELKAAFYDGRTFLGADAEYWLLKGDFDVSLSGGFHVSRGDLFDTKGFDFTALASTKLGDKLDVFAGLDMAFESVDDVPQGYDDSFTTLHLVPGIEYKLGEDLDLLAEFGLALNDDGASYLSAGFAYYLR